MFTIKLLRLRDRQSSGNWLFPSFDDDTSTPLLPVTASHLSQYEYAYVSHRVASSNDGMLGNDDDGDDETDAGHFRAQFQYCLQHLGPDTLIFYDYSCMPSSVKVSLRRMNEFGTWPK